MKWVWMIFKSLIRTFLMGLRPEGMKAMVAENIVLRQQLLVLMRGKKRCPPLLNRERIVIAVCTLLLSPRRMGKASIAIAESRLPKNAPGAVRQKILDAIFQQDEAKAWTEKDHQ